MLLCCFFKQKTAYELRISDWSSDVCSSDLPPGQHGAHVHMTGKCDAPKFESAGGHWNPADAQHGLDAPAGQHAGDMPNLVVDDNGRGTLEYELKEIGRASCRERVCQYV